MAGCYGDGVVVGQWLVIGVVLIHWLVVMVMGVVVVQWLVVMVLG